MNGKTSFGLFTGVLISALAFLVSVAEARVTRIEMKTTQSPTFEGTSFGKVGQYEKLVGQAFGEIDPTDPRNAVIADIDLAPRNARGMVEYSMDVYALKPIDLGSGNHRLFFEVNNRGNKLSLGWLNFFDSITHSTNDPTTAADAGDGFLMRQGYTLAWCGWDITASPTNFGLTITSPIATNPDGSSIVGPALEEFEIDNSTTMTGHLTYPAANMDTSQASLTMRVHFSDPPVTVTDWEYVDSQTIRLLPAGTPFPQGTLFELTYPAQDPIVAGIGFAATRDFATFLHQATTDDFGNPNPLAGDVQFVYAFGISQSARYLRDFVYLGFNEDDQGQRVFDAVDNYIGGGNGIFGNYRFAQPGRTERQHRDRWYPEGRFPFADQVTFDPITGRTDGGLRRCFETDTCPKIIESNSENEYWAKSSSLLHTDTLGNDLPDPGNVRFYLFSSLQHGAASGRGICQQPQNPVVPNPGLRALLVTLDDWVNNANDPPLSQVPRRRDGTLVPSLPQSSVGFPNIPGVTYNGLMTTRDLYDFGPMFDQGILTVLPPAPTGVVYPGLVPRTDSDGNDIAGIRLPEVAAPLATYTGWALRAAGFAENDGCDASGQDIAFPSTEEERRATGDPRRSIERRYRTHEGYVRAVERAARRLARERFLLEEDVERYISAAEASDVLR